MRTVKYTTVERWPRGQFSLRLSSARQAGGKDREPMKRYKFEGLGILTVEIGDSDREGRQLWDVAWHPMGDDAPALEFTVGEPLARTADAGPVEAEIAASAISFLDTPDAWDFPHEREVSEEVGEDLYLAALGRRDSLGRAVRRRAGV